MHYTQTVQPGRAADQGSPTVKSLASIAEAVASDIQRHQRRVHLERFRKGTGASIADVVETNIRSAVKLPRLAGIAPLQWSCHVSGPGLSPKALNPKTCKTEMPPVVAPRKGICL